MKTYYKTLTEINFDLLTQIKAGHPWQHRLLWREEWENGGSFQEAVRHLAFPRSSEVRLTPVDVAPPDVVVVESIIQDSIAVQEKDIDKIKPYLRWGTFGPSGEDPLIYVRLVDCSSDHLHKILQQPCACGDLYKTVIRSILEERQYEIE